MKKHFSRFKKDYKFLILLIAISLISCECDKPNSKKTHLIQPIQIKIEQLKTETDIKDELKRYFESFHIKPAIEINNVSGNQTNIQLANHKIKWFDANNETKIQINNDLFSLKDKITLNDVWDKKDSVDFSNNWDEIKLYQHNNKEYIGIRMSYSPCNGLGCSTYYYLIYDVTIKSKNFFGTFRTEDELQLFDFSNEGKVDFISKTFSGDANGSTPIEFIYELYSMDVDGQFKMKRDNYGIPYRIVYTTFPNDITKTNKYREHWPTRIITGTL